MKNMEIEKKYLIDKNKLPSNYESFDFHTIEQGYLNTDPVVRVRKQDNDYFLTYKGSGMMARTEYNLPLNEESYKHLITKCDGNIITKIRYNIPFGKYKIELDIFKGVFEGLIIAEVEFPSEEEANSFEKPDWFLEDVTFEHKYHNSNMSKEKIV